MFNKLCFTFWETIWWSSFYCVIVVQTEHAGNLSATCRSSWCWIHIERRCWPCLRCANRLQTNRHHSFGSSFLLYVLFFSSYLLGLLAKIKCSISSSQPDLWDLEYISSIIWLGTFVKPHWSQLVVGSLSLWGSPLCSACRQTSCASQTWPRYCSTSESCGHSIHPSIIITDLVFNLKFNIIELHFIIKVTLGIKWRHRNRPLREDSNKIS